MLFMPFVTRLIDSVNLLGASVDSPPGWVIGIWSPPGTPDISGTPGAVGTSGAAGTSGMPGACAAEYATNASSKKALMNAIFKCVLCWLVIWWSDLNLWCLKQSFRRLLYWKQHLTTIIRIIMQLIKTHLIKRKYEFIQVAPASALSTTKHSRKTVYHILP